jgi:superfamily I DNA/RNA helicase
VPHPRAEKDWEKEQERNLEFVALTRAKEDLFFAR